MPRLSRSTVYQALDGTSGGKRDFCHILRWPQSRTRDGYPGPPARKSIDTARCTPWLSRSHRPARVAGARSVALGSTTNRGHGGISRRQPQYRIGETLPTGSCSERACSQAAAIDGRRRKPRCSPGPEIKGQHCSRSGRHHDEAGLARIGLSGDGILPTPLDLLTWASSAWALATSRPPNLNRTRGQ